jgi:membrane dipeptidase
MRLFAVFSSLPNTAATGTSCAGRSGAASLLGRLCGAAASAPGNVSAAGATDAALPLCLLSGAPPHGCLTAAARAEAALARTWAAAARSAGKLQVITSRDELELYVVQRFLCSGTPRGCPYSAALLALEGAEALGAPGDAPEAAEAAAEALFERGVRSVTLHHAQRNAAGASRADDRALGAVDAGLTPWGMAMLQRFEALGVLVDLTHSSDAVIASALAAATKPLALTHVVPASDAAACAARGGALGGAAPGPPVAVVADALLSDVAAADGVVGVSLAACVRSGDAASDSALGDVARRIARLAAAIGAEHVAIGSDFDGGVVLPAGLDAQAMPLLTAALRAAGMAPAAVEAVMGGSVLRLLRATLPVEADMAASAARGAAAKRHSAPGEDGMEFDIWM